MKKKENLHFHVFGLEFSVTDFMADVGPRGPDVMKHENKLVDDIVRGQNKTLVDSLKSIKFVGSLNFFIPYEPMITEALDIPCLRWISYGSDP